MLSVHIKAYSRCALAERLSRQLDMVAAAVVVWGFSVCAGIPRHAQPAKVPVFGSQQRTIFSDVRVLMCVHNVSGCPCVFLVPRWTRRLVSQLSAGGGGQHSKLAIRMQGPYADPPAHIGQPDGVILVAGVFIRAQELGQSPGQESAACV